MHSGHLELLRSSQILHNPALQASQLRYVSCDLVSVEVHMPVEGHTLFNWLSLLLLFSELMSTKFGVVSFMHIPIDWCS